MMHASPQNHARPVVRMMLGRVLLRAFVMTALALVATLAHAGMEEGRQKAEVCGACHGADGNSTIPTIPSLAGQPKQFIVSALFMFREGRRKNDQMMPFVEKLKNADLNDLALFFSSQKMTAPTRATAAENVALGKTITEKNNCVACHTATLTGQQHIPRLAGQQIDYLREQLKLFRASTRADFDGTMTSAVQGLTSSDIEILADYLSGLSVP